jgi:hypothetical protein
LYTYLPIKNSIKIMNQMLVPKSRWCDNFSPGIQVPKNCRDPGIASYTGSLLQASTPLKDLTIVAFPVYFSLLNSQYHVLLSCIISNKKKGIIKLTQQLIFLALERVAITHEKQQQCVWQLQPNALDCTDQKENTLQNTENKRRWAQAEAQA